MEGLVLMQIPPHTPTMALSRGGAWSPGFLHTCPSRTLKLRTTGHQETCLLNWPDQGPVLTSTSGYHRREPARNPVSLTWPALPVTSLPVPSGDTGGIKSGSDESHSSVLGQCPKHQCPSSHVLAFSCSSATQTLLIRRWRAPKMT